MANQNSAPVQIPPELAAFCRKGAEALRSSERMLRSEYEAAKDDADPDWCLHLSRGEAVTCADNLAAAARFLDRLADAAPTDGGGND